MRCPSRAGLRRRVRLDGTSHRIHGGVSQGGTGDRRRVGITTRGQGRTRSRQTVIRPGPGARQDGGSGAGFSDWLLDVATSESLRTLTEQARDRRVRAIAPDELHRRQHEAQTFRHWRTALGNVGFAGELPPELGIPIVNRLDAETDRLWRKARRETNGELLNDNGDIAGEVRSNRAVLAAQAFVRLVETGGKGKARRADMVIVCDLEAYRRGHALDGEACHIVGGGPIPVSLAQELGRDAFLKAVLHSGHRDQHHRSFRAQDQRQTPHCTHARGTARLRRHQVLSAGLRPAALSPRTGPHRPRRQRRAHGTRQHAATLLAPSPDEDRTRPQGRPDPRPAEQATQARQARPASAAHEATRGHHRRRSTSNSSRSGFLRDRTSPTEP